MRNPYQTQRVTIAKVENEASDSKLFTIKKPRGFDFQAGQFVQVSLPGFGEAPISICSNPYDKGTFQLCVREVGSLTSALHKIKSGAKIGIRGPYGNGFPIGLVKQRNLLIVVGGCGIEPVRPLISEIVTYPKKFKRVQLFFGARGPEDLLFKKDYQEWRRRIDFHISLDKMPPQLPVFHCEIGLVTSLFSKISVIKDAMAFLCGPPIMYKFVLQELKKKNFSDADIYLSLERRMHCGIGACQHCAVGPHYVCKDGPVFSWEQIKNTKNVI